MLTEWRLLLECARPRPEATAIRTLMQQAIDWPAAIQLAERHGLEALLAWRVGAVLPGAAPPQLSAALHTATKYNLELAAELLRVIEALQSAGISVVPFKGPAIAWSLYDTPALRRSSDLDLLVPESAAQQTIELLVTLGYRQDFPGAGPIFIKWNNELPLTRSDDRIHIDLHWRLHPATVDGFSPDPRLEPVEIAGRRVMTLAPADLLLYLSIHGAKHLWLSLNSVCDIALLLDRHDFDWDRILSDAQSAGATRRLFVAVLLAHRLLDAKIPQRIESDPVAGPMVEAIIDRMESGSNIGMLAAMRFQAATLERLRDKLRFYRALAWPTINEWQAFRLPRALFGFYYLFRPLRLAWKWRHLASKVPS